MLINCWQQKWDHKDKDRKDQHCWKICKMILFNQLGNTTGDLTTISWFWGKLDESLQYLHWAGSLCDTKNKDIEESGCMFNKEVWFNTGRHGWCWNHWGRQGQGGMEIESTDDEKTGDYEQQ